MAVTAAAAGGDSRTTTVTLMRDFGVREFFYSRYMEWGGRGNLALASSGVCEERTGISEDDLILKLGLLRPRVPGT
jgi:hypothetical protein